MHLFVGFLVNPLLKLFVNVNFVSNTIGDAADFKAGRFIRLKWRTSTAHAAKAVARTLAGAVISHVGNEFNIIAIAVYEETQSHVNMAGRSIVGKVVS